MLYSFLSHVFNLQNPLALGIHYLIVVSLFIINACLSSVHVGCADFVPRHHGSDKERFNRVVAQARTWVDQQQGLRFINIQSIDYKLKKDWGK